VDVAHACLLAATVQEERLQQRVFNVTAGEQDSYRAVAAQIRKIYPDAQLNIGPGTLSVLDENARFDISAAVGQLGYHPRFDLHEGIAMYAQWLEQHPY
jgi:UDP-glucose 4-epimerase